MTDIIIFSGQSNMQGETESRPMTLPVPRAMEYLLSTDTLIPLNHPVGEDLGFGNGHGTLLEQAFKKRGSLVPAFCRAYRKACDTVVAVHAAMGATTLADWDPSGERYQCMITKIRKAKEKVGQTDTVRHIYFVWLQGESDAINRMSRADYLAGLIAFKNALKADVGIEKFGMIRVGYFVSVCPWLAEGTMEERIARDEAIMMAQEDAAKNDADFLMLTDITKDLSRDNAYISTECEGHFNNKAMELIGTASGRMLARYAMKSGEQGVLSDD